MSLFLIDKVPTNKEAFAAKVIKIATELGVNPDYLMACMYFETAGTFDPAIQNSTTKATGLIQFMPSTALGLGTTIQALAAMSNVQQLDYVRKYFLQFRSRLKTLGDVYLTIFYPAAVGKPSTYTFPDSVKIQNPVFQPYWKEVIINGVKKMVLQKASIEEYMYNRYPSLKTIAIVGGSGLIVVVLIIVGILIFNR